MILSLSVPLFFASSGARDYILNEIQSTSESVASQSLTKDIPKSFPSYCTPKLFRQTSVIEFQENLTPAPRSEVFGIVFVRPRIKDKLTLLDGVNKVEILASVSSSSTPLSIDQLFNEHTESEQNAV